MPTKIEILLEVDPGGKGAAGIKSVKAEIKGLETAEESAGKASSGFMDVFKGNLLYSYFKQATSAVYDFGVESVKAYAQVIADERFLNAQIKETGVNFAQAHDSVDAFDHKLALSKENAEKLYATTLQFVHEIGKENQADKFIQSLSDVLVSHGVSPEQQADITRSLLAGRATELGKVLGENLQTIEKELSKQAGVDFSSLDDAAKKQLLFNKVLQEGEKNAGAAALRLGELDGKVASIGAAYDRAKESAGKFITTQTAVKGIVDLLNYVGGGATEADYQKAQDARIRQEALARADARDKFLAIQQELNLDPSKRFKNIDYLAASQSQVDPDKLRAVLAENAKREALARGTGALGESQAALASTEALKQLEDEARAAGVKQATALHDGFTASYKKLFKPGGGSDDLTVLDYAKKQFDQIKGILDPGELEDIGDKLNAAIRRQMERGLAFLKQLRASAESEIKTFAEANAQGGDNPFAKIYLDAQKAAKDLKERFGGLDVTEEGRKQYGELEAAEGKITETRLAGARVDAQLSSERLRRQAEELKGINSLTAAEERRLSIQDKQIAAALKVPELLARAGAIDRGRPGLKEGSRESLGLIDQQIQNLLGLGRGAAEGRGEFGERARSAVDKALISMFEGLPETVQKQIARGGLGREFSAAYRREAGEQTREVQREIERSRAADRAILGLQKDLDIIRKGGLPSAEADKRILGITGALSEKELTGDLRKARFDALNREADRQAKLEAEGKKQAEDSRKATENLVKAVDDLAKAARDPQNRRILIEVINKSKAAVRDELYGSAQ